MKHTIRGRDGAIREVADGYILQDGEACVVEMSLMDGRHMVHDGLGQPAGQRPGFLYSDNEQAERARADAYEEYARDVSERWRLGPGQPKPARSAPQAFDNNLSPEDALHASYEQYRRDIEQRWRR